MADVFSFFKDTISSVSSTFSNIVKSFSNPLSTSTQITQAANNNAFVSSPQIKAAENLAGAGFSAISAAATAPVQAVNALYSAGNLAITNPLATGLGLFGASVASNAPKTTSQITTRITEEIPRTYKFTEDLGGAIDEGNLTGFVNVAKEYPVQTTALAIGGATAAGLGFSSLANYLGIRSLINNTNAVKEGNDLLKQSLSGNYSSGLAAGGGTSKQDVKIADITGENALNLAKENNKAAQNLAELQSKTALELARLQASPNNTAAPTLSSSKAAVSNTKKKKKKAKVKPKSKKKPTKKAKKKASKTKKKSKKRKK